MENDNNFFANDQHRAIIKNFDAKLSEMSGSAFRKECNDHNKTILESMLADPGTWDKYCKINIESIGQSFIKRIQLLSNLSEEQLDEIYSLCYRFLSELNICAKDDINRELNRVLGFTSDNIDNFSETAKSQIIFAIRDMPIVILKKLINHENINSISDFNSTIKRADELKIEWNKELEVKEGKVKILKDSLDRYKNAFNFVGLYEGFDSIARNKKIEKNIILACLIFMGGVAVLPLIIEAIYTFINIDKIDNIELKHLLVIIPTISLIGILVYYFRVLLVNYKSVKSQILQIELRKTLCRFIQSYVEYADDIKKRDKEVLSKFENIIFSGIVSNDEKLPTTFDGLEKLASFIKSMK